jgi:hypothetical protein
MCAYKAIGANADSQCGLGATSHLPAFSAYERVTGDNGRGMLTLFAGEHRRDPFDPKSRHGTPGDRCSLLDVSLGLNAVDRRHSHFLAPAEKRRLIAQPVLSRP